MCECAQQHSSSRRPTPDIKMYIFDDVLTFTDEKYIRDISVMKRKYNVSNELNSKIYSLLPWWINVIMIEGLFRINVHKLVRLCELHCGL